MLFDTAALAPHGACLLWRPNLLWLHAAADGLAGLSFLSITAALLLVARHRRDLAFRRIFGLFALFILAAGLTSLAGIWTLWRPDHGVEGVVKAIAAVISAMTAVLLWRLLPRILALPTRTELAAANAALSREVAERREAEARARASEARFAGFFAHVADGLFVVRASDAGFVFETVNPSFAALLGLPRERIEGASPEAALSPAAAAELTGELAACLGSGRPRDWESSGEATATGGLRHWHTVLVPLPSDADGTRRLLGSVRDITELRRLQAELVETTRRAVIGTMCAGVAHEMSQPVNIIGLWAERSRAVLDTLPPVPRRALEVALHQTRRLGTLLERMRDLTLEGGDGGSGSGAFDAAAAVQAAVEVARRSWALDGIAVEFVAADTGPAMLAGRAGMLEQAMLHLLENARDAVLERRRVAPGAPGRITVSIPPPAAGHLTVLVRDSGCGVPPALGDRILDPFVTTKEPGHGSGLGLPIAAGLIRALGGTLCWRNCTSSGTAPGEAGGAEFRLVLPLQASCLAEMGQGVAAAAGSVTANQAAAKGTATPSAPGAARHRECVA